MLIRLRGRAQTCSGRIAGCHLVGLILATICCSPILPAIAEEAVAVRVEEDWVLDIGTPDPNSTAPQVISTFSPKSHLDGWRAAFELNHQSQPFFTPGGLQLHLWNGDEPIDFRKIPQTQTLSLAGEQVSWTQAMSVAHGELTVEIINGTSSCWGAFGGQGYLKMSVSTNLTNLNNYDPAISVQHSGVGYAANRVDSLVLKQVRVVFADGQIAVDDQIRIVCQNN